MVTKREALKKVLIVMGIFWKVTDCPVPVFMPLNQIAGWKAHNTSSRRKTKDDNK
jgi:hypothetical protein